ncbi:glycosyltransferase (plasmid) [Streptomyces althioticus]|uniref:glycosyltransferase n=1 Tax=Streptomyces althioticus TaxID=83380 RepID=UPI003872C371|nr:glycosyltransferase [Streptomyces althioticus]
MMKVLSLITPVHAAGADYLASAYASLAAQQLPAGWEWEWLVQEDGEGVDALRRLPGDSRIRISQSRRGGPHVARTVALGRSRGELIKTFDADDVLTPGVLARDIEVLADHTDIGWTTSAVLDLLPDGSLTSFPGDPAAGRIASGTVLEYWEQHKRPQIHPATLCMRRSWVAALGGWMALPASGDTGLLLGLDAIGDGYFTPCVGLHYRKHSGQITALPQHSQGEEWQARMQIIGERARALKSLLADQPVWR